MSTRENFTQYGLSSCKCLGRFDLLRYQTEYSLKDVAYTALNTKQGFYARLGGVNEKTKLT